MHSLSPLTVLTSTAFKSLDRIAIPKYTTDLYIWEFLTRFFQETSILPAPQIFDYIKRLYS